MRKSLKKSLSVLMTLVILSTCFCAFGADLVAINEINFPDPIFREVIRVFYDETGDGYLNADERNVTTMSVQGRLRQLKNDETNTIVKEDSVIKNLKGIEYFADGLRTLRCGEVGLETLDLSSLEDLEYLSCNGNELTSLDLTKNVNIVDVRCQGNNISDLNISGLNSIQILYCYTNQISSLDISKLISLEELMCFNNELESLNTSKNPMLKSLNCSYNHIISLDLSKNTALGVVTDYMIGNQTSTAQARMNGGKVSITFIVDSPSYITTSSLDTEETKAYTGNSFIVDEVDDIADGIDYTYYVGLNNGSPDMRVHLDIVRDFYQVNFYTSADLSERLGYSIVSRGDNADAPDVPSPPQCMAFGAWSEDITNITEDKNVYIVWEDNHNLTMESFVDGVATVSCDVCNSGRYTINFIDCVNSFKGDGRYVAILDVVKDDVINAKDYSKLDKMF